MGCVPSILLVTIVGKSGSESVGNTVPGVPRSQGNRSNCHVSFGRAETVGVDEKGTRKDRSRNATEGVPYSDWTKKLGHRGMVGWGRSDCGVEALEFKFPLAAMGRPIRLARSTEPPTAESRSHSPQ